MSTIIRYIASGPGAAVITIGLGLLMANLIKVSFTPQEKPENLKYDINVVVKDEPPMEKTDPPIFEKVVPPPAPPKPDFEPTLRPNEELITIAKVIPDIKPIVLDWDLARLTESDQDEQPIVRMPPIMPPRAEKSGHCNMQFDVSPTGQPFNIAAVYCSARVFKRASIKAVDKWKYNPKIQGGTAVVRRGVKTQITFNLKDERGRRIPE